MTDEDELHGTGRRIENASEGTTLQTEKKSETAGALNAHIYLIMDLNAHIYLIMDAQLNIQSGAYVSSVYQNKMFMKELHTALFISPTGVGKLT